MKDSLATAFEQIVTKSHIDVLLAKVNASLIASHKAGCFEQCEWLLNKYIDEILNQISVSSTDEKSE